MINRVRTFAWIGLLGALWALTFAAVSSLDYASHLDRGLHDLHCSFIPGASASEEATGCRVALNSPYAAFFKQRIWGGIPISLFGVGCFAFLVGHAIYLLIRGARTTRHEGVFYFLLAVSPAFVSAALFAIAWFELGTLCKTCTGIYIGSLALALSALGVLANSWRRPMPLSIREALLGTVALAGIALWTLLPSLVYAAMAPDHGPLVTQCGKLAKADEAHGALLELRGPHAQRSAVFFEDPLCPTCKSLHERLAASHVLDRLNIELALFPLDNDCNWMLDQPMHPGACQVSRAVLCADSPGQMLDWAYRNQELLAEAGKRGMSPGDTTNQAGVELIRRVFEKRFGNELVTCMGSKATTQQLNRHLHFAVDNAIAVSTPQVFIDGQRLCDEDIDIGLMFALSKLAPGLLD